VNPAKYKVEEYFEDYNSAEKYADSLANDNHDTDDAEIWYADINILDKNEFRTDYNWDNDEWITNQ